MKKLIVTRHGFGKSHPWPKKLCKSAVLLLITAAMVALFCGHYGALSALAASDFAPLPNQPTLALTNPIILVSPTKLDFGPVSIGETVTKEFLVENIGRGTLVGIASVSGSPFKITSDQKYSLKAKQIQVVTVAYTPKRPGTNSATVTFTGGGGIKAKAAGKGLPKAE